MKENGFTYIEALLSLMVFTMFILAIQQAIHVVMEDRVEQMAETEGYLLAYSLLEQWKAGLTVCTGEREHEGRRYHIRMVAVRVTEMIEKCEVQVAWKNQSMGERHIGFTGYRFTPVIYSVTPEG